MQTCKESTGCSRDLHSAALHPGYRLDLIHALGYLWEAVHLFHPDDSDAARTFVEAQARRMLRGGRQRKTAAVEEGGSA